MSTTHYAPSRSAASSERYVRGLADERGVAVTCDVPGGPGEFSRLAEARAAANDREVEASHYRQSFDAAEFDPDSAEDVQRVNDLGYQLGRGCTRTPTPSWSPTRTVEVASRTTTF